MHSLIHIEQVSNYIIVSQIFWQWHPPIRPD